MSVTRSGAPTSAEATPSGGGAQKSWFWRYWGGTAISRFGTAVTTVALPLAALGAAHASSFEVGVVAAAGYLGWLLIGLPAGVWVGRLPLRETQIAMDLVRAVALASVPLAWWLGMVTVVQLVVVALVVSLASVVFGVGNAVMLPFLVPKEELTARNSLTSATESVTTLAGPSLGGALVQLIGAASAIVVDVVSYLVSAFLLRNLPRPPRTETDQGSKTSMTVAIREGWRFLVRHPVMRACLLDATATNFVGGALLTLTPLFLVRTLGLSAGWVGVQFATEGVGSLIGASVTPRLARRFGSSRTVLLAAAVSPVALVALPLAGDGLRSALFGLGNAVFGATVVVASIQTRTFRQVNTPRELLPRVAATVRFISWGVIPLGSLLAGGMAAAYGPRAALWATCVAGIAIPVVLVASPIRSARDLSDE
jgi:MFS family permease